MSEKTTINWRRAIDPAFIVATVITVGFYAAMLFTSLKDSTLAHYTTEHVVEYVIVALFVWGLVDILFKIGAFPREAVGNRHAWLPARTGRVPVAAARALLAHVQSQSPLLVNSRMGKRLVAALQYVVDNDSAEDFSEHLHYLADQDHQKANSNYTLIRFVIGVTPILGFLGTVVHFGGALGGFSLENLDAVLPAVVSKMGTAFNTTTVALGAAMSLMFALYVCERIERGMVSTVDNLVESELATRFEVQDANISPFLASIQHANADALRAIVGTLQKQIDVWGTSLETLYERFDERQKIEREAWQSALEQQHERHLAHDAAREEQLKQILLVADSRQAKHLATLQTGLDRALNVRETIEDLTRSLQSVARGEGKLLELQHSLSENLRVIHEARQIDNAMHGLTAAIHMLTARNGNGPIREAA